MYKKCLSALLNLRFFTQKFYCAIYFLVNEPIIFIYQIQLRSHDGLSGGYQFVRLLELKKIIKQYKPNTVMEFGSGASSLLFAKYSTLISLEESPYWLEKYTYHLNRNKLIPRQLKIKLNNSLFLVPRVEKCVAGEVVATYESVFDWKSQEFDLVYVDGPTNWLQNDSSNCKIKDPLESLPCFGTLELSKKPKIIVVDGRRATVAFIIKSGIYDDYNITLKGVYELKPKINPYHTIFKL